VQSSSAIMVMLVGLVQTQLMTYSQALGVILGAEIGTTVTAQLIAFRLNDYALLIFAAGFCLKILGRKPGYQHAGEALAGFGLLFFGMQLMSEAMIPLRSYTPFIESLHQLKNPLLSVAVGMGFTALIQSSSAFVGIVIVLAQQGVLTLEASIPLMLGSNIGTCVTAAIASIGTFRAARRVSLAQILFNVFSVTFFLCWIPESVTIVRFLSPGAELPRQIANAHTLYNLLMSFAFLPFTPLFGRLVFLLLPDKDEELKLIPKVWHLKKSALNTPSMALSFTRAEMARMNKILGRMLDGAIASFTGTAAPFDSIFPSLPTLQAVKMREEKIDYLETQVTDYLFKIVEQPLSDRESKEAFALMNIVKVQEEIGDIIEVRLLNLLAEKETLKVDLTTQGKKEITELYTNISGEIHLLTEVLREMNPEKAAVLLEQKDHFYQLKQDVEYRHLKRVEDMVAQSKLTHTIHMELMDSLRQIHEYNTSIARAIQTLRPGREDAAGGRER
ncbi:MAG TPA: Na/Pi cotransporter family protein, partial [Desulfobulbaceae bacterium]|nr:Na/Pi cotransporter family protein [Desulfobulbaceae bacterium]